MNLKLLRREQQSAVADIAVRIGKSGGNSSTEERSIDVVLATEEPVPVVDLQRMAIVPEILLMDGMEFGKQIPIVDSHDRTSVRNVLGSIRNLRIEDSQLVGRAFFGQKEAAREVFQDIADGHTTDFSVTAMRKDKEFVERGETRVFDGRTIQGPARVVTRSRAIDGSVVAVGADPNAKVIPSSIMRESLDPASLLEEKTVEKLIELCRAQGMPEDVEGAAVFDWLERSLNDNPAPDNLTELITAVSEAKRSLKAADPSPAPTEPEDPDNSADVTRRALAIVNLCDENNIDAAQRNKWAESDLTVDQVARKILEGRSEADDPAGLGRVEFVESELDKVSRGMSDALILRIAKASGVDPHKGLKRARGEHTTVAGSNSQEFAGGHIDHVAVERNEHLIQQLTKPSEFARDFRYASLFDMARTMGEARGLNLRGLPNTEVVRRVIGLPDLTTRASDGAAFNTTGGFANLMLDATNKTLLAAFDEVAVTYPMWVRQAPSASDFKQLNRIRFGELPDPEVVHENAEYPDKTAGDERESYRVEKYGELFSISMEAIINDDLNAISRIPQMQGNAMRRKINKVCYGILTANAALDSDSIALFHASSHNANLDTVALATAALNTGYTVMMTQAGVEAGTILNITPRFLIVPAALAATAMTIIGSVGDPSNVAASTEDASRPNFSSATVNLYGPQGMRPLTLVVEGQLDGTSTTGWYLAASSSQIDTVELTFLEGEESPVLSREEAFTTDGVKFKIRQTFASKAIDYRGLYQGNT